MPHKTVDVIQYVTGNFAILLSLPLILALKLCGTAILVSPLAIIFLKYPLKDKLYAVLVFVAIAIILAIVLTLLDSIAKYCGFEMPEKV